MNRHPKSRNTRKRTAVLDRKRRGALLDAVRVSGAAKARKSPSAARSQDFLYDKDGLPK
jgi:hypothetical protein